MEYKVVAFVPATDRKYATSEQSAKQLEELINHHANQGWDFIALEGVTTYVKPDNGCFGFGGNPGFTTVRQMAVFKK